MEFVGSKDFLGPEVVGLTIQGKGALAECC